MIQLLRQWLARLKGRPPAPPQVANRRSAPRQFAEAGRKENGAPSGAASAPVVGARRPLVSGLGALAGFEFHVPQAVIARLLATDRDATLKVHLTNLLGAMRACVRQEMGALVELPAQWLPLCEGEDLLLPGMYLALRPGGSGGLAAGVDAALLARLRDAGARIGWHATDPGVPSSRPDFVLVQAPQGGGAGETRLAITLAQSRWPEAPLVLLDLPDVEVLEAVLSPRVVLAACALGSTAFAAEGRALPPQAQRLLQLLNRLVRDDDLALLVTEIKADAALSLRLLQFANSAGVSTGRTLESIEQVIMVLGRDELYRWVAQLLVKLAPPRPAAEALQALALARGRVMELLARGADEPHPGSLYLLGLASMLPVLMQCGMEAAIGSLNLPPPAQQALREGRGPWQVYLDLVQALERNDLPAAEPLSAGFGGLDAVLAHWTAAWQRQVTATATATGAAAAGKPGRTPAQAPAATGR